MAQILETWRVTAYDPATDSNRECLVARAHTMDNLSKLFRVSPDSAPAASVRIHNGIPQCAGKECGGSCIHTKALAEIGL